MKQLTRVVRGNAKLWLLATVLVVSMLAVTQDRTPASADTTEVGPTLSATGALGCGSVCAPDWISNVYVMKGGHAVVSSTLQTAMTASAPSTINVQTGDGARFPSSGLFNITIGSEIIQISSRSGDTFTIGGRGQGTAAAAHAIGDPVTLNLSACPESDPATSCVYIWAKNVDSITTGVSGFQVDITYDSSQIHVASIMGSTTWVNSTGRAAICAIHEVDENPSIGSGHAFASCNTLGQTPAAPKCTLHCNGLLATLQIESVPSAPASPNSITLNYSSTYLLDLPTTACGTGTCSGNPLPATLHSMTARIVKCANVIPDPANLVLVNDIVYMVNRYRTHGDNFGTPPQPASPTWDPRVDMDGNNQILVSDVTVAVGQYRRACLP